MTTKNQQKKRFSLLDQIARKKNRSDLVIGQPIDRNVAQLHSAEETSAAPDGFDGSSQAVYTHNDSQASIKDQMNENSKLWWDAKAAGDTDWMKSLEAANQQLAALLGDGVNYNPSSGTWSGAANMPTAQQGAMNTGINPQLPHYDYDAWLKENPAPTFQSAYNAKIDELINAMLTRDKFSYSAENDPLFQQYKDIYTREGNRSMNDTLAAAAAGAGGMSSYAMTAAQQANNYYMAQLGDKIPELHQLAYDMYLNDLNLQRQDIGMLIDKDNIDYNRYRDSMSDWYNDRNFGYGMYRDQMGDYQWGTEFNYRAGRDAIEDAWREKEWQYGVSRDQIEDAWREKEWDYGVERDQIADQRYDQEWQYGLTRDQIEDAWREKQFNYGVSQDQLANYWKQKEWDYGVSRDQIEDAWREKEWGYKTGSGYNWGGGNDSGGDPESSQKFWDSIDALGIGTMSAGFVLEIAEYGGIIENADGTVQWAPGWNADNYEEKLRQAKNHSFLNFLP